MASKKKRKPPGQAFDRPSLTPEMCDQLEQHLVAGIGQNSYRYQFNGADQLASYPGPGGAKSISYNPQGQTTQLGDLSLTYNQSQQIKEAQSNSGFSRYEYDASGRRVAKEVNGEREEYLLLGQEVLKTFDRLGGVKADYFLGLGREGMKTDGTWKYYLTDGLGSTALLTDDSGNTVAAYDYEDYGATTQIAGDAGVYNPYRYTGQEWDPELGMYNLRARHYSPSLGRFLARDPIGSAGGSNLMAYCQGDPVDFVDPSGLKKGIGIYLKNSIPQIDVSLLKSYLETTFQTTVNIANGTPPYTDEHEIRAFVSLSPEEHKIGDLSWELGVTAFAVSTLFNGSLEAFYNSSSGKVIATGQLLSIHPTWTLAQADARAKQLLYTNDLLHELGHALSGIGDKRTNQDVMSYGNFTIGASSIFLGLLPLPGDFISKISSRLCE